jgi:hypothetical protein
MNDGYRHSMCLDCWNKKRRGTSPVGHKDFKARVRERCCFCGDEHRSGIHVAKNPKSHELRCEGQHDYPKHTKVTIAKYEAGLK